MKTIKVKRWKEIPENFTGIVEFPDGKFWFKEFKIHREDGPAIEHDNGTKGWSLEDNNYLKININDYVVLGYEKGKHGIMWYKLLDKDHIIEYPDIPGLITK